MRSVSPSTQGDLWCSLPYTAGRDCGRDCDRQSVGRVGGSGVRVLSTVIIALPSLSCRLLPQPLQSVRGRWVGRFCQSCRSSSGRSSFPPLGCLSLFSHRRCAVSFAFAVPSCGRSRRMWLPCSAVALDLPVPRALISSDFGRNCDTRCVKSVREVFS